MKEKIQNYATIIIPTAVLIAGILLIWWAYGPGVAEVMTKRTTAEEIEAKAKVQTTSETGTEATAEADTLDKTAETDALTNLAKISLSDLGVDHCSVITHINTMISYSEYKVFEFSDEAGPTLEVRTDEEGRVQAMRTAEIIGYPTCLYYIDEDSYYKLEHDDTARNYLLQSCEPIAKVTVGNDELLLDFEQLVLVKDLFGESVDYLLLTEIGQLGHYGFDGTVYLAAYLEDCGFVNEDGIYWASDDGQSPKHEGFALNIVEHDGKSYLRPTFYVKNDKDGTTKQWRPGADICYYGEENWRSRGIHQVKLGDDEVYASEFVLEGIMQCVQRSGGRFLYSRLDPGRDPITYQNQLLYYKLD